MFSFPLRVDYSSAFLSVFFFFQFILLGWFLYIIYSASFHPSHFLHQVLLLSRCGSIAQGSHEKGSWRQGECKEKRQEKRGCSFSKTAGHRVKVYSHSKDLVGLAFNLSCSYCQFRLILGLRAVINDIFVIHHNLATSDPNNRMNFLKVSLVSEILVIHECT